MRAPYERKQRYLVGALAAGAALAGGAVATAGDEAHPQAASTDRAAVAAVAPEAPGLIAAFRRDQRSADRLPGNPHGSLVGAGEAQPAEQPGMARRLAFANGRSVHIWPKAHGVCYGADGGGGCFDTAFLRERGIAVGTSYSSDTDVVRVYGIARDGIGSVAFTLGDGRNVEVPVRDNGFVADVPRPKALTWQNVDGTTERQSTFVLAPPE